MPPVLKGRLPTRTGLGTLGITIDTELVEGGGGAGEGRGREGRGERGKGRRGGGEETRKRGEESWSEIREQCKYAYTLVGRQG